MRAAPEGQEPVLHFDAGSGGYPAVPLVLCSIPFRLEKEMQHLLPQLLLIWLRRCLLQLSTDLLEVVRDVVEKTRESVSVNWLVQ